MGLEFLRDYGAHRMRDDAVRPLLLDNNDLSSEQESDDEVGLDYEEPADTWKPIDVQGVTIPQKWSLCPRGFIDGKDLGRTVAWLQTAEGFPIPVRLSEIGAVMICNSNRRLQREWH